MNLDNLNKWLMLVANFGVIAGIIFLVIEIRQNSDAIEFEAAQSFLNGSFEIDLLLAQDAELSEILLKPEGERTNAEQFRFERFSHALLTDWQNFYDLHSRGILDTEIWQGQAQIISGIITNATDLQRFRDRNRAVYTPDFNEFLDSIVDNSSN